MTLIPGVLIAMADVETGMRARSRDTSNQELLFYHINKDPVALGTGHTRWEFDKILAVESTIGSLERNNASLLYKNNCAYL